MKNKTAWMAVFLFSALAASAPAADELIPNSVTKIADFDGGVPEGVKTHNARAEAVKDGAAAGAGSLRLAPTGAAQERRHVRIPLPAGTDLSRYDRLVCQVRATQAAETIQLRWCAVDGDNWIVFQRRFDFKPGREWVKMEWPLHLWRWGNFRVGDWPEVKSLVIQIESPVESLEMDELALVVGRRKEKSALPTPQWYQDIAFAGANARTIQRGDVLVATDAVYEMTDADLAAIADRVDKVEKWVRRAFAESVRANLAGQPLCLFIFRRPREYHSFFKRLGEAWNVEIVPPDSGGYTVQDIAASTYDEKQGANRPVYLHEMVHGVIARQLRLLTSVEAHTWLQEGAANYLQLCLYPDAFDRNHYVQAFAKPVDGTGLFRPLKDVMTERASAGSYAQLASLIAFLAEDRPRLLRDLAVGLREGKEVEVIMKGVDTDFESLQKEWLEWGRKRFSPAAEPPAGPGTHFPLPLEWTSDATTKP